jgi:hypothetical protein
VAVRLTLRIRVNNRIVDVIALLNSGFKAPTPQLIIPINTAKTLEL